ncbi:MAG: DUF448 domain-containing protein [Kofleriaceae bacterium]|nr:DUF448 domain-containing protein [Kofleriaceae bacterium]MBP6837789.1 DUF448 domain-containing protein [Kofleriaceae bacterium]MBP9207590.1 DUF448 domain-containing protein [Kofleriaceae bacterium]
MRTCVLCRGKATRAALARVVADGDRLVFDRAQRRPGRGAYVHATTSQGATAGCARAAAPGLFERALRTRLTPASVAEVVAQVRAAGAPAPLPAVSPSVPSTPTNPSSLPTTSA